jgi:tetratricopeptide (TPR) repeat protein
MAIIGRAASARVLQCLALLLGVASPVPASAEWRRVDSPNFVVVGDVGARDLRDIAVKFEAFRETLSRLLTERATATAVPTVVIVFPSDRAFTPLKPLYNGKPIDLAGYFMPRQDATYIAVVAGGPQDGLNVVFHEYAHLITSNTTRQVPTWLNEGVAEYYSTFEVSGDGREALIGRAVPWHLLRLRETRLLSLDQLLNVDRASSLYNEGDRRSVFYAQSWALTHMILQSQPKRTNALVAYLTGVGEGKPPGEAWNQAFGPKMERELEDYVRRQVFRADRFTFSNKLATFDAPAVPLAPANAQAFLADFLLQQKRYDEAAERLAQASKLDPANVRIAITRALLDIERRDYASAEKQLLALGEPLDWLTAYFAAAGIAEVVDSQRDVASPQHLQKARELFGRVKRERGELPNALARLAALEAHASEAPPPETRAAIERARSLTPGRHDYAFLHAQVLARQSEFAAARNVLGPLMTSSYPENIREAARTLMQHIVRMESAHRSTTSNGSPASASSAGESAGRGAGEWTPVFRRLEPGEQRLEGLLENIECSTEGSVVFQVRTAEGAVRLTAARFGDVEFITYRDDVTGTIKCGPLGTAVPVYASWRIGASDTKVAVAIEFLPKRKEL